MNCICCENCHDIIAPIVLNGVGIIRKCFCGSVHIRAVPDTEHLPWNVEVKIYNINVDGIDVEGNAKVIKINNQFLSGELEPHEFYTDQKGDLFDQNNSQIVITSLDIPGVKFVQAWSNEDNKNI